MVIDETYRIRSSIALVKNGDKLELFKANIRESLVIKIEYEGIIGLLLLFDGTRTTRSILLKNKHFSHEEFYHLINFMVKNNIFIQVDQVYSKSLLMEKYRLVNLIEEYATTTSEVINCIQYIERKTVMVIGMGAVGTWVVDTLARTGVTQFILVDDDKVELSNLHRQDFFFNDDVGKFKIDCVEERLQQFSKPSITKIYEKLDDKFFVNHPLSADLVINCADYPSVDHTTYIIGKECMPKNIPHLIGGGYNLHLSLIGQTVIPNKTACVKCFDTALKKINNNVFDGVKKLNRKERKIGSFGPLCALSASLTSIEALKILINKYHSLVNTNKRIEFRIREQDFYIKKIPRDKKCEWCS